MADHIEPMPTWTGVIRARLRQRRDMMVGVIALTLGMSLVLWFGSASLGLPVQILLVLVGVVPNVAVILGMVYDYADVDVESTRGR